MTLFVGSHSVKLDSNGRLMIPAAYRDIFVEECDEGVVMTLSPSLSCGWLFPDKVGDQYLKDIEKDGRLNEQEFSRIFQNYHKQKMDPEHRMLVQIQPKLRKFIRVIAGELVTVAGSRKPYLEIWNDALHTQKLDENLAGFAGVPSQRGGGE